MTKDQEIELLNDMLKSQNSVINTLKDLLKTMIEKDRMPVWQPWGVNDTTPNIHWHTDVGKTYTVGAGTITFSTSSDCITTV